MIHLAKILALAAVLSTSATAERMPTSSQPISRNGENASGASAPQAADRKLLESPTKLISDEIDSLAGRDSPVREPHTRSS